MIIKPSTSLKNKYNEISDLCKTSGEPIYLTKNGKVDLVVMSIETFEKEKRINNLTKQLLESEIERICGEKGYSLEEAISMWEKTLEENA